MELVLVRHGETEWSSTGRHTGHTDLDLVESGREEALAIRSMLAGVLRHAHDVAIYTSAMRRATLTAAIAFPHGKAQVCDLLQEYGYGDYEGLTAKEIRGHAPDWDIWRDGCPNGEQTHEVGVRADRFLSERADCDKPVVAFSHGHMIRILAARALGLEACQGQLFTLSTASISVIRDVRGKRVVALWNWIGGLS